MDYKCKAHILKGFIPLFFILAGCISPQKNILTSTKTSPPQPSETSREPTITLTFQPSEVFRDLTPTSPLASLSPTAGLTPIARTEMPLPSLTPLPTLLPDQMQAKVVDLLENNAGCQLPCWWGMTPGITPWEDARRFLEPFDGDIYIGGKSGQYQYFEAEIPTTATISPITRLHFGFIIENNIITQIDATDYDWPSYHMASFLNKNGKPDEVWVYTVKPIAGDKPDFYILLFYPTKGFLAYYIAGLEDTHFDGKTSYGCMNHSPNIYAWTPDKKITLQEFGKMFNNYEVNNFTMFPLEKATGMSVDTFYERYKISTQVPCFQSPIDIWPEP